MSFWRFLFLTFLFSYFVVGGGGGKRERKELEERERESKGVGGQDGGWREGEERWAAGCDEILKRLEEDEEMENLE